VEVQTLGTVLGFASAVAVAACGPRSPFADCVGADCDALLVSSEVRFARTPGQACALKARPSLEPDLPPLDVRYDGPPIGAIRWDAWTNDPELGWWDSAGFDQVVPPRSRFHYRKPSLWDDFQLYGPCVDTQAIVDAEIAAARGKLDFWLFVWYPPRELLAPADRSPVCDIQLAFDAYSQSTRKRDIKFALLLQHGWMMHPDGTGAYFQAYSDWIAKQVRDPQYQRIDGKPLIVLYNDARAGSWINDVAGWEQLKATIGEEVFGVSVNSVAMLRNCSLQANMTYGPNGALLGGSGRRGYDEQMALDAKRDAGVPGAQRISSRTALSDRRPFMPETVTTWIDQPTQPQWFSAIRSAIPRTQKAVIIYSWNEVSEGGPGIVPTFQEGARYLDAIDWARKGEAPSTYTYPVDFSWLYVTSSGTWTESFPEVRSTVAAHDGDEVLSSTAGDYKEFEHQALREVHIHATTGPDRGMIDITVDVGSPQTIDLYSPRTRISADVATLTFTGAPARHTVRLTVRGDKNPASKSAMVGLDYAQVSYDPAMAAEE
jgi:hypothetical protein